MSLISNNRPRNLEDRLPHGNTQMINYVVFKIVSETLWKQFLFLTVWIYRNCIIEKYFAF